jgi:hypothetical protein
VGIGRFANGKRNHTRPGDLIGNYCQSIDTSRTDIAGPALADWADRLLDRGADVSGRRTDSERRLWFRSPRVFAGNGKWYFHTREGLDLGPYDSRFEAEVEAEILAELLGQCADGATAGRLIREFAREALRIR